MSTRDVFRASIVVLLTLLGAYILFSSFRIFVVLIIALIIASSVRPLVQILMQWRLPEGLAIVLTYLGLALVAILVFVAILPPIASQFVGYIENDDRLANRLIIAQSFFQRLIQDFTNNTVPIIAPEEIRANVANLVQQIRNATPSLLNNLGGIAGDTILIFVMGVYWLTSHDKAINFFTQLTPTRYKPETPEIITEIEDLMGNYLRGVFLVGTLVGLLNFIPMTLFNVPNALIICVIIGITTTIPMVGGLIGGITAVVLTLIVSTEHVLPVLIIFLIVQQIENHVISPRIMSSRVGLDPLLVIVYTSIGLVTGGVLGALLAVPVMATLHVLLNHLVLKPYKEEISEFETEQGVMMIKDRNKEKNGDTNNKLLIVEDISKKPKPEEA